MNFLDNNKIFSDKCIVCGKKLLSGHITNYCYNHLKEKQRAEKLEKWLNTGDSGYSVSSTIRGCIREYIMKDQNNRCAICQMEAVWNGKEIRFVMDHIDGDASNSKRENLRLICPNCDSQLPTFKSKNKNSARKHRINY